MARRPSPERVRKIAVRAGAAAAVFLGGTALIEYESSPPIPVAPPGQDCFSENVAQMDEACDAYVDQFNQHVNHMAEAVVCIMIGGSIAIGSYRLSETHRRRKELAQVRLELATKFDEEYKLFTEGQS